MGAALSQVTGYKTPFKPLLAGRIAEAIRLELVLDASPRAVSFVVSQHQYSQLWVGRFRTHRIDVLNKKVKHKTTPGDGPGRLKAPTPDVPGSGALSGVARSYISARMWSARNSLIELLEPMHYLLTRIGRRLL